LRPLINPVRAGVVSEISILDKYPYCGHSAIMGKEDRPWQDTDYVLACFGKTKRRARKTYSLYIEEGFDQGHREEFIGGGLIRSLGGWSEIKKTDSKRGLHVKSDERILGESDFVSDILSQSREKYERKYELKRLGFNLDRVAMRVSEIYGVDPNDIFTKGKQKKKVKARSLLCHWAVNELGIPLTDLARRIGNSVSAVGYSVVRGAEIEKSNNFKLID
jgi:putative transposase